MYLAPSLKYLVTNCGINLNFLILMTKHLLRISCGLQAVLSINKAVICSSRYAYRTPISLFSEQIARPYKDLWVNNQYKVIIFFEVLLWSKQRYPPCSMTTFFDGHKIAQSCMTVVFMAQFNTKIPHNLFFSCTLSESLPWLCFSLKKKKKKKWKLYWLNISLIVCLKRPLQFQLKLWLAAGNSHKEKPSKQI